MNPRYSQSYSVNEKEVFSSHSARHRSGDYYNAIVKSGESSAVKRWGPQRELVTRYKQGGSILDIGCSSGGFLSTMDKGKWELYGIEISPETAEKARLSTGSLKPVQKKEALPGGPFVRCFGSL